MGRNPTVELLRIYGVGHKLRNHFSCPWSFGHQAEHGSASRLSAALIGRRQQTGVIPSLVILLPSAWLSRPVFEVFLRAFVELFPELHSSHLPQSLSEEQM